MGRSGTSRSTASRSGTSGSTASRSTRGASMGGSNDRGTCNSRSNTSGLASTRGSGAELRVPPIVLGATLNIVFLATLATIVICVGEQEGVL